MISADILLKGLGGVAVVGGATGMGVCYHQKLWIFAEGESLKTMGEKVGLVCNAAAGQKEETGVECTIKDGGLSVKQGTNKETGKKKDTTAQASTPAGKIKGYKDGNGFKFVIEEGDITLKEGSASNISKLEQFETYEIKEDGDKKQYLTRKTEAKEGIKKALGLDQIEGCDLPKPDGCPVDGDKFKKIKFSDGDQGRGVGPENAKLKITAETNKTEYPLGYKFVLESNGDATITTAVSIKGKTNTEFKIKRASGSNGISLEKVWTVNELAKKAGLKDCAEASGKKECSLGDSINVNNGDKKKYTGLKKGSNGNDKKVKYEENVGDHNQGFKFYVEDADIALQDGTAVGGGGGTDEKKILKKNGAEGSNEVSYEIKKEGDNWFLIKKTKTPGG